MLTVDSQVHAYERNHPGRPWLGTLQGPAEVTGDQMVAAMDAVGVDGAVLVSPFSMYGYDASYALEVYAAHPGRFGLVKPVDPNDPGVTETVADWAATKGTVGIRVMKDLWDPLFRIFDAFGFNRCLWGTDWTRAVGLLTYQQGVEAFRVTDRRSDSDRAALMGETLTRVYHWSPATA
jgi:predicted TIM-barrel fold metal-dependent hydrolase